MMEMRLVRKCSVCKQEITGTYWGTHAQISEGLLGAAPYEWCTCCGQGVENFKDVGYRRRFRKWYRKETARMAAEAATRRYEEEQRQQEADD